MSSSSDDFSSFFAAPSAPPSRPSAPPSRPSAPPSAPSPGHKRNQSINLMDIKSDQEDLIDSFDILGRPKTTAQEPKPVVSACFRCSNMVELNNLVTLQKRLQLCCCTFSKRYLQVAPSMQMFDPFGSSLPMNASTPTQPNLQPQPADPFLTPAKPKSQSYTSNHIPSPLQPQKLGRLSFVHFTLPTHTLYVLVSRLIFST